MNLITLLYLICLPHKFLCFCNHGVFIPKIYFLHKQLNKASALNFSSKELIEAFKELSNFSKEDKLLELDFPIIKNMYDNIKYGYSKKKYNSATEVYNDFYDSNEKLINTQPGTHVYSNIGYQILGVLIEKISNMSYSDFVKENILIPLKMNNTGIQDCNITLYDAKIKKLTKFQKWERTFASSAGELKSCVHDLIKFSNFFKLLNKDSIEILKKLYIFEENIKNNTFKIGHNGGISGGASSLLIKFHKNFIIKNIYIKLETGVN